ncbi:MAG TPA: tetratricopeptide repeat protein [Thermoanaerobaculia bacterium]
MPHDAAAVNLAEMRAGFIAGAAFVIGVLVGVFLVAPNVGRQPQTVVPQQATAAPAADPFETARAKGNAAMDAQRCEEAIAAYESALAIRFDADAATDLGVCLRQLGRKEQALATFEFVTLKEPAHWQARYNMTAMLLELGHMDRAKKSFAILQGQKPDDAALKTLEQAFARVQ